MDFKNLAISQDFVKKELIKPNGEKTGVVLHLVSTDSPRYKEFDRELTLKNFKKVADNRGNLDLNTSKIEELLRDNEKTSVMKAAMCIVGWEGMTENGEPLPYSHEKAIEFLSLDGIDWVIDMINDFAGERANFIKG